jgi:hypothetical protein
MEEWDGDNPKTAFLELVLHGRRLLQLCLTGIPRANLGGDHSFLCAHFRGLVIWTGGVQRGSIARVTSRPSWLPSGGLAGLWSM